MQNSLRKMTVFFFSTVVVVVVFFGYLSRSLDNLGFVFGGILLSVLFTVTYYGIRRFVAWLNQHYGIEGEEKIKWILAGALFLNLMPFVGAFELWPLVSLYFWPATVFSKLFNINSHLLVTGVFWTVVGGALGYCVFRFKRSSGYKVEN